MARGARAKRVRTDCQIAFFQWDTNGIRYFAYLMNFLCTQPTDFFLTTCITKFGFEYGIHVEYIYLYLFHIYGKLRGGKPRVCWNSEAFDRTDVGVAARPILTSFLVGVNYEDAEGTGGEGSEASSRGIYLARVLTRRDLRRKRDHADTRDEFARIRNAIAQIQGIRSTGDILQNQVPEKLSRHDSKPYLAVNRYPRL